MERSGLQSDWIRNRARLTGVRAIASIVALAAAALIFAPSEGEAASRGEADGGSLLGMASKRFPDLSRAERALLEHSDVRNPDRPAFAQCETSSNPDDPSNDPRYAVERPHEGGHPRLAYRMAQRRCRGRAPYQSCGHQSPGRSDRWRSRPVVRSSPIRPDDT
jgi:hypothetical protein